MFFHLVLTDNDNSPSLVKDTTITASTRPVPRIPGGANIIECPAGSHGELSTSSGTESSPNVYRCSSGRATYTHAYLWNRQYVYLEGLTFTRSDSSTAIRLDGSQFCVVRRCTINAVYGGVGRSEGITNC